jgi:TetR/AcrR family transcriptional regulator, cholesterol catabolism regulator
MNEPTEISPARERLLAVAEQLFMEHGYAAVTLADVAGAVGIKQASLYYHVPGGKEELFAEAVRYGLRRHQSALLKAIAASGPSLEKRLIGIIIWYLQQPPVNFSRMLMTDLASITPQLADQLREEVRTMSFMPLVELFVQAQQAGHIRTVNPFTVTGMLLGLLQSLHTARGSMHSDSRVTAKELADIFLRGIEIPAHIPSPVKGAVALSRRTG